MEEIKKQQTDEPVKILSMDMIQSQTVQWLWYPYIPYGKITIVQGDPGEGKTTLVLNLAALLSQGNHLMKGVLQVIHYLLFIRPQRMDWQIRSSQGWKKQEQTVVEYW